MQKVPAFCQAQVRNLQRLVCTDITVIGEHVSTLVANKLLDKISSVSNLDVELLFNNNFNYQILGIQR